MKCEEAQLMVQALLDNELAEKEIEETLSHIESCHKCRKTYVELILLKKSLRGITFPDPGKEWFENLEKNKARKGFSFFGKFFFFGSYLLLIGYALFNFFKEEKADLFLVIAVAGVFLGIFILLGISIADRIKESKTDRYKEVMK